MNLLIDIGNSRVKWLLHDNVADKFGVAGARFHNQSGLEKLFSECWDDLICPDRVLIANVSGSRIIEDMDAWFDKKCHVDTEYVKTEAYSFGVKNGYDDYSLLGVDRWMAIIAAWHRFKGDKEAICVVDCGTATTIDGIIESGQHLGGFIFPGYTMMQEALINNTSGINDISKTMASYNFSNTTEQGINSGCQLATISTIDRVINSMKKDYGERVKCIITGGNAELVIDQLAEDFEYEPNLVLHGLALFSGQAQ